MMEFREFIRKPVVVYEEEQPEAQQPEPEQPKGNILQPNKKLILPNQPKMSGPKPEGKMVDAFPNARQPMRQRDLKNYLREHDPRGEVMSHMIDHAEVEGYALKVKTANRLKELEEQRPYDFDRNQDRSLDSEEDKKWRELDDEYNKIKLLQNDEDASKIMGDIFLHEYTANNIFSTLNHYLRYGEILRRDPTYEDEEDWDEEEYPDGPLGQIAFPDDRLPRGLGMGDDEQKVIMKVGK